MPNLEIDDQFLDVDFPSFEEYVFGDLGAPDEGIFGSYEDTFGVMSDAEVREAIEKADDAGGMMDRLVTRIFDQKRTSSCTCNAVGQAHECTQAEQFGKSEVVHVSSMSLYKQITNSDSGSNIGRAGKALADVGILPLTNPENTARFEHTMENANWNERMPRGWEKTANMLRSHEWFAVKTPEGARSALCRGDGGVVGRDGHAIYYSRLMWDDRKGFIYKYPNSWKDTWGDKGYGYDSESKCVSASRYFLALRSVRATPEHLK